MPKQLPYHLTPQRQTWRKLNAAKLKAYWHNHYIVNKVKITLQRKQYYKDNIEKEKITRKNWYEKNKISILASHKTPRGRLHSYKKHAKVRGHDFELTTEDFNSLLFSNCYYCDKQQAMGIDRVDNHKGYYSYNVVACCWDCNSMKGARSYKEFIEHITRISLHLGGSTRREYSPSSVDPSAIIINQT